MNRRQRLMSTLRGEPVDRPAVSFYELNGLDENPAEPDPFNIYTDPSWKPLLDLTREKTDRIVMRGVGFTPIQPDPIDSVCESRTEIRDGRRFVYKTVRAGSRTLTSRSRRDPDVNTVWTEEHLLKDVADLKAFLEVPEPAPSVEVDTSRVLDAEAALGDTGIVMIDTPDPLCLAAFLFDMAEYTVIAMTEPELFHRLVERMAATVQARTEAVAQALPGRLWRIFGPEYASPPYLPPNLFREYVVRYDQPMVRAIQRHGGFARIHSHGKLRGILDAIREIGPDALDPIEPPPQGDMELSEVRAACGREIVLFGNLEVSDIENLPTPAFEEKVRRALAEGTAGAGRGFVLMPSASPYGRKLPLQTLKNYEAILRLVESWGG
jgi:hypothetical protein